MCWLKKSAIQYIIGWWVVFGLKTPSYIPQWEEAEAALIRVKITDIFGDRKCSFSSATLYPDCVGNVRVSLLDLTKDM